MRVVVRLLGERVAERGEVRVGEARVADRSELDLVAVGVLGPEDDVAGLMDVRVGPLIGEVGRGIRTVSRERVEEPLRPPTRCGG
jgi:hypothetical protein